MWKQSTGTRYGRGTRWSPGTRISLLYPGTVGDKAAWQGSMIGGGGGEGKKGRASACGIETVREK